LQLLKDRAQLALIAAKIDARACNRRLSAHRLGLVSWVSELSRRLRAR